ncbi:MAG TPA: carboxypeptidase-like regulatory domain-containing protein, partial [Thermoanaerobaculia bacterium]
MISSAAFIVLELLGRLVLSAGSTAVGQVIDDAGEPVAAEVALRNPEDSLAMAGTADDGRFAIPRVPPGKYDLEVRASGFATARVPGVAIDAAGEVDLGTVVLARAVTLSGRVIDAEGVPITGAEIATHRGEPRFSSFEPPHGAAVTTAADGAFALPDLGADEQWVLAVTRNGYAGRMVRAVTAHGAPPLEIVLHPASRLAGRVIDDRAHPVAGAAVMLHPVRSDVVGAAAQTDVDGRFRL